MPQLHLYLPDKIAAEIKRRAKSRGTSASRLLAEIVTREISLGWPDDYFDEVVGRWEGALERPPQPETERRDTL